MPAKYAIPAIYEWRMFVTIGGTDELNTKTAWRAHSLVEGWLPNLPNLR